MIKFRYEVVLMLISLVVSCNKTEDVPSAHVTLSANKTNVKVGETVVFTINHNVTGGLSLYTGDEGHDYETSAYKLLAGKTEEELQNEIFTPANIEAKPVTCSINDTEIGAASIKDDLFNFIAIDGTTGEGSQNLTNTAYADTETWFAGETIAEVVPDPNIGKNVYKVKTNYDKRWANGFHFKVGTKLGQNRKLVIRWKFSNNEIYTTTSTPDNIALANVSTVCVEVRLGGICQGESTTRYTDAGYKFRQGPSESYVETTMDLSDLIVSWEAKTAKTMEELSFVNIHVMGDSGSFYFGDIYVESVSFGGIEYFPFSTGVGLNIGDNSGVITYPYVYTIPGTYTAVVIGDNVSLKNYSDGGYRDDVGGVGSNEYKYSSSTSAVRIVVSEWDMGVSTPPGGEDGGDYSPQND